MYLTSEATRIQANLIRARSKQSGYVDIFNSITSDVLLDKVESLLPEHRERLFPPTETLALKEGPKSPKWTYTLFTNHLDSVA